MRSPCLPRAVLPLLTGFSRKLVCIPPASLLRDLHIISLSIILVTACHVYSSIFTAVARQHKSVVFTHA